jgi:hypothetical protein
MVFLGWLCFYVHLSSIIQHPSIHPSIHPCCFTAAALVLLQMRSDHQKHKFLASSTKNLQFVGGRRKQKNLAERSNNENPVVVVMRDLNHAVVGNFALICATKF